MHSPPAVAADDTRPLLAIVDSGGRVTRFAWPRDQPFWRDILVLCSSTTPAGHLERLRRHFVDHLVIGGDRVDLGGALTVLRDKYGVEAVRVDAGGTLNGALLRNGHVWLRYACGRERPRSAQAVRRPSWRSSANPRAIPRSRSVASASRLVAGW